LFLFQHQREQVKSGTKVQQNIDICKENLKNLANKWKNVNYSLFLAKKPAGIGKND
jgi:hypothetical protein